MTGDYRGFPRYTGPEHGWPHPERRDVDRSWERSANCLGADPDLFFPAKGDMATIREAKAICAGCSVRQSCLEANLHEQDGVWGGTTGRDRVAIRRKRQIDRVMGA